MIDLIALHGTFRALRDFVCGQPALAALHAAAAELEVQAGLLASGKHDIQRLADMTDRTIPNRADAARIVAIMNRAPTMDGSEPEELRRALAVLFGNLVLGVTHPILRDYPDLMRSA